ncbi:PQQ-binding-like beta-propeller repeat protein [Chamaesiphon polymorphus]|uniref:Pyrrolo-quinoline quinone repeat domain-containing protein n=1 Tax=Chamaesiphon polymorphus CCALA 037 TaxID=2107692 RepID=A0A2T1GFN7_9CYAN|nr:PQQ-binding-like beta-propeller repeat protein [Chamaesiphon polymorphus]PSB56433.1 hypothetical protein C7B77_11885 [Chamaesiphon polymorphus CCALA 037]
MSTQKLATQYRADDKRLSLGCFLWMLAILSIPAALVGNWGWNYLNSNGTALIALDANSGKYLWSSAIDNDLARLQPLVVARDRVFVRVGKNPIDPSDDRSSYRRYRIEAFSTSSGQKLRSFNPPELGGHLNNSPRNLPPMLVDRNRLWLNMTSDRQIVAAKNDGKEMRNNPALGNIRQGKVLNIDTQTGKLNWSVDRIWSIEQLRYNGIVTNDSNTAILRISPTLDISVEAYNSDTGQRIWETQVATITAKAASPLFHRYRLLANSETIFLFDTSTKQLSGYSWDTGKAKPPILTKTGSGLSRSLRNRLSIHDRTIYSLNNDATISALDLNTGTQRWEISPPKSSTSCPFLHSMTAERSGIYLLCLNYRQANETKSTIISIDRQTGKTIWYRQYSHRVGSGWGGSDLISNSKTVYGILQNRDNNGSMSWEDAVVAIANTDGKQRWQWQSNFRLYEDTIAVDEERFFAIASVPRWRLLFGAID